MEKYFYKCRDCGAEYSRREIEDKMIYLCPKCGTVEKNRPLKGILLINYDYKSLGKKYSAGYLLNLEPGRFWLYDFLWPLEKQGEKLRGIDGRLLGLIELNPLLHSFKYNNNEFSVLDDSRNPTLSYKDRATTLVVLKALQKGIKKIAAASTGNAGSSLAGICARAGLESVVFVPENIPESKRIQIQSYGAELLMVKGDYDLAFDTCMEIAEKKKWFNRNTAYNPLTIEGKKSSAYDIFILTKGKIPDMIFVPTGDGVILSGIYKGFWELKQLGWIKKIPAMIAVQADGSRAVADFCRTGRFNYKPASSIADSICAGAPRGLYTAFDAVNNSGGMAVTVSDKEILSAQEYAAAEYGILTEPSSAASFAGYRKLLKQGSAKGKKVLLLFTGNGLKDTSSLLAWNKPPKALSLTGIKKKLGVK